MNTKKVIVRPLKRTTSIEELREFYGLEVYEAQSLSGKESFFKSKDLCFIKEGLHYYVADDMTVARRGLEVHRKQMALEDQARQRQQQTIKDFAKVDALGIIGQVLNFDINLRDMPKHASKGNKEGFLVVTRLVQKGRGLEDKEYEAKGVERTGGQVVVKVSKADRFLRDRDGHWFAIGYSDKANGGAVVVPVLYDNLFNTLEEAFGPRVKGKKETER